MSLINIIMKRNQFILNPIIKIKRRNFNSTLIKFEEEVKTTTTLTTPLTIKVPIKLISELRTLRPGTPLNLAKKSLSLSSNDLTKALEWLTEQSILTGEAKMKKLESREATQGLIGVLFTRGIEEGEETGLKGAMVELSCETDFVARTEEFKLLVEQITRTLHFFAEDNVVPSNKTGTTTTTTTTTTKNKLSHYFKNHKSSEIENSPLIPIPRSNSSLTPISTPIPTISSSIATIVSRLGENINLRRSMSFSIPPSSSSSTSNSKFTASTYLHNASPPLTINSTDNYQSGTLASLLLFKFPSSPSSPSSSTSSSTTTTTDLETKLNQLTRALARQVVAIPTLSVSSPSSSSSSTLVKPEIIKLEEKEEGEHSTNLYDQPLITLSSLDNLPILDGSTVRSLLKEWSSRNLNLGDGEVKGEKGLEVLELERWTVGGEI